MFMLFVDDNEQCHDMIEKNLGKDYSILHAYDFQEMQQAIACCQVPISSLIIYSGLGIFPDQLYNSILSLKDKKPQRIVFYGKNNSLYYDVAAKLRENNMQVDFHISHNIKFLN